MDVATLDIRIAVPDDAAALAGTTRLGFESYRAWAPEGWRAAAAQPRDPLDPRAAARGHHLVRDGARPRRRAGRPRRHHPRRRARAPARAHSRPRAPVDAVRAPALVGERAGGAPAPARARGGGAPGLRDDPALHAVRRRPRPRVLRARGLGAGGPRVRRAAAGAGPGRVPSTRCDPRAPVRGRRRALARLDAHPLAARAGGLADDGAGRRSRCAASWAVAKWLWGHPAPFFAPVAAIIALGPELPRARPAGGRARRRGHARRRGRRPARLPARHRRRRSWRWPSSSPSALGMFFGTSQLFVNQVAISAALVFTITPPTGGFSFARTLDALTGGLIALAVAAVDPARRTRCGCCATPPGRCSTSSRRRCEDIADALRARDADGRRGGAGAGARDRRVRRAVLRRDPRGPSRPPGSRPRAGAREDTVEFYTEAAARIDLAVRNVRVLARGAMRALALDENVPPEVADALEDLARAVRGAGARAGDRRGLRSGPRAGAARRGDRDPRARGHGEPVGVA